ncbi:membrane protein insertion efficiency factor YidD [Schlegelella sp. S2-27]|uniref:Putative membrane protein insertion efficiency factor n=1 Tax=Caldimonas mangrovi TaxID=2944811 RepID=A0ABT0YWA0_9BURK|nr:membrane protein insertion efficiency factor YidD [Caldimonas mangrovi]MCM5682592.1 membrane protein insertion efficiency factor YidD [Caldimonas mangrovi]
MVKRALLVLIRGYRLLLSPWLGAGCRFHPTCSAYSLEAIERHGAAAGSYLMARRLVRCGPWCEGGFDAVPEQPPRLFTRFMRPSPAVPVTPATVPSPSTSESSP